DRLELSPNARVVDGIRMTRQAGLQKKPYRPLIDVRGMACWPTEPLADQLDGTPPEPIQLTRGKDFDEVVLGIPPGALGSVAEELIQAHPRWKDAIAHIRTIPTQAMQLWFCKTTQALGWPRKEGLLTGYAPPYSTW